MKNSGLVGRPRQPHIRQRLLDACTDHSLEHGLPDRLAPLAAAAGTSSRMLIYHFGTRDGLLLEVLKEARRRQVETFGALLAPREDEPFTATLERAWSEMSGETGRPFLRLFGDLHDRAGGPLWPDFRRIATTDWLEPLRRGLEQLGRPELATLTLAVIRGLLMDLDAVAERERVDAAFAHFVALLTPGETVR